MSLSQVRALLVDLKDDNLNPDVKGPIMYSSQVSEKLRAEAGGPAPRAVQRNPNILELPGGLGAVKDGSARRFE